MLNYSLGDNCNEINEIVLLKVITIRDRLDFAFTRLSEKTVATIALTDL